MNKNAIAWLSVGWRHGAAAAKVWRLGCHTMLVIVRKTNEAAVATAVSSGRAVEGPVVAVAAVLALAGALLRAEQPDAGGAGGLRVLEVLGPEEGEPVVDARIGFELVDSEDISNGAVTVANEVCGGDGLRPSGILRVGRDLERDGERAPAAKR